MPDVVIGQARVSANTSLGTQDITSGELGGKTPKAVLLFYNYATGDGAFANAGWGIGAASGATERWTAHGNSKDGEASTDERRVIRNDAIIRIQEPGDDVIDGEADFDSFITNGVRIDWTNAPSAAFQILAIFFAGTDVEGYAGFHPAEPDGLDITDPGFQPNLIAMTVAINQEVTDDSGGNLRFGYGWQDGTVTPSTQSQGITEDNGEVSGAPLSRRLTDESAFCPRGDADIDYAAHYDTFDANGMTARIDPDDSDDIAYLALKLTGADIKVAAIDSPTSSGNWAVTGIGFKPKLVLLGLNMMTVVDSARSGAEAGSQGIGSFTEDNEFSFSAQIEDAAATTNTQSYVEDKAAHLPEDDGTVGFVGDYVSMDSDGWTLDFTAVPGTARKWFYLAIGVGVEDAQGQVSWAELECPNVAGQGQVSWGEFETPDINNQGQVSWGEFECPDPENKGQVSWAEFECPDETNRGQISWTELETPDVAGQGQVSWTELEIPDVISAGQVSWTEFEVPDTAGQGQVSWTELEVPNAPSGQVSWATFKIPCPPGCGGDLAQVSWVEFETPDDHPAVITRGSVSFTEFEIPDVWAGNQGQVSGAEFKVPVVNTGEGSSWISWAELETPDADALIVTQVELTTPDPRRRGRVSWGALEFPSRPGVVRDVIKIYQKDYNRELVLEELAAYGVRPDLSFALAGFEPLDPEDDTPLRVWTPSSDPDPYFNGVDVEVGEIWLAYSYEINANDEKNIDIVLFNHIAALRTQGQIEFDQDAEDRQALQAYLDKPCSILSTTEQADALCKVMRLLLRYHPYDPPTFPDEYKDG